MVTATAEADILDIVDWLTELSVTTANRFIDNLEGVFVQLAKFPLSGRARLSPVRNRRVVVRGDYVVTYEFTGHEVVVRRVLRGSREQTPF